MISGEFLTRLTIWITIAAYTAAAATFALSGKRHQWDRVARLAWTVACVGLLAHVTCAFHVYHGWSHTSAYLDTARQTDEVVGLNWGGGLYINYALLICWVLDVAWWWLRGLDAYRRRPWPMVAVWHGFLIFIIFNSTVVFKTGFVRWAGLSVCLGLCVVWWLAARDSATPRSAQYPPAVAED
ncbi:MAG: hypothetical protein ND895_00215 [Pyrinomonadaceae bacterium]|nr:hypothetical protein [Pyrinomonadaceae bacterium]